MKKEDLIKKIDEAISTEEKAIPIYVKHLESLTDLSELEPEQKKKLKEMLEKMRNETREHKNFLENLKEEILESDEDEY